MIDGRKWEYLGAGLRPIWITCFDNMLISQCRMRDYKWLRDRFACRPISRKSRLLRANYLSYLIISPLEMGILTNNNRENRWICNFVVKYNLTCCCWSFSEVKVTVTGGKERMYVKESNNNWPSPFAVCDSFPTNINGLVIGLYMGHARPIVDHANLI
jgi:hypothetical protein